MHRSGDLFFDEDEPSRIVDVAVGANGVYSLLDQTKGHIFTYDDNGNLLYIWGNIGNKKSDFQMPTAISYMDSNILVLDSSMSSIQIYEPTVYGKLVLQAEACQYNGDYDEAYKLWSQIADQNTNFKYAFVGLGNAKLSEKNYDEAITYFEYANDQNNYSKTLLLIRKQDLKQVFPIVMGVIIVFIVVLILYSILKRFVGIIKDIHRNSQE